MTWQSQPGETDEELVTRAADDLPSIFDCMVRFRERQIERGRIEDEHRAREAERRANIEAAREAERRRRQRVDEQTAFADRVVAQAVKAREIRQFLAEAPRPQTGQDGYGRMLATLAERLAELERNISPGAVEVTVKAQGLFPSSDDRG